MLSRETICPRRRLRAAPALLAAVLLVVPALTPRTASLAAQVSPEILQVLQQGGAWVTLAIEDGVGSFESAPVPTLGIQLRGHLRIAEEHTGSWHVVMRDLARGEDLVILEHLMVPGERVEFDYQTGMLGQIQIDVQWSEARDTTLRVWVGTELAPGGEAADLGAGLGTTFGTPLTFTVVYCDMSAGESCALSAGCDGLREQAENLVHQRCPNQRGAPALIERWGDLHHVTPHEVETAQTVQERNRLAAG